MLGFNLHWIYAHLIGDFILQNDHIGIGKKKSHKLCLLHIFMYMLPFLYTSATPLQFALIAVQHYLQDRWHFVDWFCDLTGRFEHPATRVWGRIIVDQILHILWMAFVFRYI